MKFYKMEKNVKKKILIWQMLGEMIKKWDKVLSFMKLFLHTIMFSENFISKVKEPSHFSMLESKLWHSKTVTKNVAGAKMVKFTKSCDQYHRKFNFFHFFSFVIVSSPLPPFC